MTDKSDNQTDRLERMLRQWGADEAERNANPPAMPGLDDPPARSTPTMWSVLRWAPLAAAAMLLAASGVVLYTGPFAGGTRGPAAPLARQEPNVTPDTAALGSQTKDDRIGQLEKEAADLREHLADANSRLAELTGIAINARALRGQLDELRTQHEAKVAQLVAASEAEQRKARDQAGQLEAAKLKIAELGAARRVLQAAADEGGLAKQQVADLRKRLTAAANELTRRRKAEEAAGAKLAEARLESQRMAMRHREIVDAFQRTYLASVAPGQTGLEARKTAVRARQMLDRLAKLSGDVKSENTRQLLDRLEAVLTRLDLINADRAGDAQSFSRLLGQGDLERQIEAALAAPGQAEDVKNWLFEAKLILTGGANAG